MSVSPKGQPIEKLPAEGKYKKADIYSSAGTVADSELQPIGVSVSL
jgi:hypothetical protein